MGSPNEKQSDIGTVNIGTHSGKLFSMIHAGYQVAAKNVLHVLCVFSAMFAPLYPACITKQSYLLFK